MNNILTLRQVCERANERMPAQAEKRWAGITGLTMLSLETTQWFRGNERRVK